MEQLFATTPSKYSVGKQEKSARVKIFSREQELADQIWNYFGKKLPFPRIMKMISGNGYQAVYEIWNEVKNSDAKNHLSLFIWKIKNIKIQWNTN